MSLDFSCGIQMVGSEFGVNNIKAWIHPALYPSCLVSTVQAGGDGVMVLGIFSWHTLGHLVPSEHRLNATPC